MRAALEVVVVHGDAVDLGDTEQRTVRRRRVVRTVCARDAAADGKEVANPTSAPCVLASHSLSRV